MNYRNKANLTLLGVSIGFFISLIIQHFLGKNFYTELLMAVMEAALVGGAADWFAITAIYSKPLGVAYHTEIVPRNREKIIDSISSLVENELLSVSSLESRIDKMKLGDKIINLSDERKAYAEKKLLEVSDYIVSNISSDQLKEFICNLRKRYTHKINAAELVKNAAEKVYGNKNNEILDFIISSGVDFLKSENGPKYIHDIIYKIKKEKTSGFLSKIGLAMMGKSENDVVDIDVLTDSVVEKAIEKLETLKEKDNYYRREMDNAVKAYIDNLNQYENQIEDVKNYITRDHNVEVLIEKLLSKTTVQIGSEEIEMSKASSYLFIILKKAFYSILNDEKAVYSIENAIKKAVVKLINSKHYVIGKMVRDTLDEFDNSKLNAFIDDKVGDDLQWIRINGSVVGSFAGLVIFLIVYFIYNPYIAPFIRGIF